jgi:hypothetical protein
VNEDIQEMLDLKDLKEILEHKDQQDLKVILESVVQQEPQDLKVILDYRESKDSEVFKANEAFVVKLELQDQRDQQVRKD